MTEPQKEYIITEKLLSELEYYAKGSWVYEVRSRPYKSDAVLDDFELINSLKRKYRNEMAVVDALELVEDEVLAVQREQKERER